MKKFLFATHGTLATGMKSTLELLIGNTADITCLTAYVNPEDNVDEQLKVYFSEVSDDSIEESRKNMMLVQVEIPEGKKEDEEEFLA